MEDSRQLRKRPAPTTIEIPPVTLSKRPLSGAERSRRHYAKLKRENPEEYQAYLAQINEENKARRENKKTTLTEEEKERLLAMNRVRVQRCREKKAQKEETTANADAQASSASKPLTRQERDKKEEKKRLDRERKRLEREGWSRQRRKAESLKTMQRRQTKKQVQDDKVNPAVNPASATPATPRSDNARKQALYRLSAALPKDPAARQETIEDFVKHHPAKNRYREAVHQLLTSCGRKVVRQLVGHILSLPDKKESAALRKLLGFSRQRLQSLKGSNSLYGDTLRRSGRNSVRGMVRDFFYMKGTMSADKKSVKSSGATKVLSDSIGSLYREFKQLHPEVKVGRSFFFHCRPRFVKVAGNTKLNQCLCEVCANLQLRLQGIRSVRAGFPTSIYDFMSKILCQKQTQFHERRCLHLECDDCGLQKLDIGESTETVVYSQWEVAKLVNSDKTITKKRLVTHTTTLNDLVDGLRKSLKEFLIHLFTARWQYSQFTAMKTALQESDVMMVYDFAENYRSTYQDEVQSAHWNYTQATLHPVVCYYRCSCGEVTTHSVVIISDDLTHDHFAVDCFVGHVYDFLLGRGIRFSRSIEWSDGCAAQYKSKGPFYNIQKNGGLQPFAIHRNYFGSRHGKNPSDGESAVIKSAATRAVLCRRVAVQDAQDLFNFAVDSLNIEPVAGGECSHFQRSFILVKSASINRTDKARMTKLKTMPGTRNRYP